MSIMIKIRSVPDDVHRKAKARVALEALTLSDLALRALEREIASPTVADLAAQIRALDSIDLPEPAADLVRSGRNGR